MNTLENNNDLNRVVRLINQGKNIFLTGFAGTGKSFILNQLKDIYKESLVVTSTTGISASNVFGQTIHSWAGVSVMEKPVEEFIEEIENSIFGTLASAKLKIRKCKLLAIDEISMFSAYQLEYLDKVFKAVRKNQNPFGGIQVILIGDFLQLPPVVTLDDVKNRPRSQYYSFESPVWKELNLSNVILKKIYRQKDLEFARTLNNFRMGQISNEDVKLLEKRFYIDDDSLKNKLHIFPTRIQAQKFNESKLNEINLEAFEYKTYDKVNLSDDIENTESYKRKIYKEINSNCQAEYLLKLKVGCRVMLISNRSYKRDEYLVNGSCGTVLELSKSFVVVKFDNGLRVRLYRQKFVYSENGVDVATRYQIPLKLAYAVTIHKSQGMSFDEVVINCLSSFSFGQIYVGLSRVKTLEGLYITGFDPRKIKTDMRARQFYMQLEDERSDYYETNIKYAVS